MLKYYSYYNVGGYKDMFLGDSSMKDTETYYLPLLSIWKKKAASGDSEAESKIKAVENLPKIQLLSLKESLGLPKEAESMFSHGGYKIIYTVNNNGESIFAIRDIESSSKDESGRTIPFLLVIVGTTESDAKTLEKISAYASSYLDTFSQEIAALFNYDSEKNGVIFKLSAMNAIAARISTKEDNSILTLDGPKTILSKRGTISLLVLPEGISKELAVAEQGLKGMPVQSVPIEAILPLDIDNREKLITILRNVKAVKNSIFADRRIQYIVGGAVLLGFIVGYFLGKS